MATASGVFAVEGLSVLDQVARGLVQKHSWLKFEVLRVFIAQQNGPCFLVKPDNLVCCAIKTILKPLASRRMLYQKNR
jgi:hypothetical protein